MLSTLELLSRENLRAEAIDLPWRKQFVDNQVKSVLGSMVAERDASLVRLIGKRADDLTRQPIIDSLGRAQLTVEFMPEPDGPPEPVRTPKRRSGRTSDGQREIKIDGQTYACRYAKDILIHTAEWVISQGKLNTGDCPVVVTRRGGSGQKRCLVNSVPRHPGGHDFMSAVRLSNGLYIEAHASRSDLERYSRYLLGWSGTDADLLVVDW